MNKAGIAIVGAGFAADLHLRSYEKLRGQRVEIIAICAPRKERAAIMAQRFAISNVYTDYRQLLERKDIQAVDLCVPTHLHHSLAIEAAEAGKHIICEKPLTGYFGEGSTPRQIMMEEALKNANSVLKAIQSKKVKFCYAENFVYAPSVVKVKSLLKAGQGTILDLRAEESHSGSHAAYSREWRTSGGGSLMRLGSHPMGVILHLKHYEGIIKSGRPIRVRSILADVGHLTKMDSFQKEPKKWMVDSWVDVEDWSAALITFADGSKGTIHSTDVSLGGVKNLLNVYLSNAVMQVNINPNNSLVVYSPGENIFASEYITEKVETKAGWQFPSPDEDWMRGYPQELEDFVGAIIEDRPPVSGIELAYEVVESIYAAYLSAETGKKVELSNPFLIPLRLAEE